MSSYQLLRAVRLPRKENPPLSPFFKGGFRISVPGLSLEKRGRGRFSLIREATSSLAEQLMKRRLFIALLVISVSVAAPAFAADALKKLRIASKGAGETLLPYLI